MAKKTVKERTAQQRGKRSVGHGRSLSVSKQSESLNAMFGIKDRVMVSEDGLYTVGMISQWEYPGMFRTAREECVYEVLRTYVAKMGIKIAAPSSVDALNVLKEAAIVLAGSGILNTWFARWMASCCQEFERHFEPILVTNRPDSY